jgi:hypothetical protein
MIDETGFVAVVGSVDDPFAIEVKEKREELAVVDDTTTLGLGGRDDLANVNLSLEFRIYNRGIKITSPAYSLK